MPESPSLLSCNKSLISNPFQECIVRKKWGRFRPGHLACSARNFNGFDLRLAREASRKRRKIDGISYKVFRLYSRAKVEDTPAPAGYLLSPCSNARVGVENPAS